MVYLFAHDFNVRQITRSVMIACGVCQMGDTGRFVSQNPGAHQISRKDVGGTDEEVASSHPTVKTRALFKGVYPINESKHGGHSVRQFGNMEIKILIRIRAVAFFS